MNPAQLNTLYNRHDPARKKAGLSWLDYLYILIGRGVSFFEIMDLAGYVRISEDDYNNILIALYTRANNHTALNRLRNRLLAEIA